VGNSGSLKGYIPPWNSYDFDELVKMIMNWKSGFLMEQQNDTKKSSRLFFLNRQKIVMLAYRQYLSDEELATLKAYKWRVSENG